MQFALQDLRKWGCKKIFMNFYSNALGKDEFIKNLHLTNSMLGNIKCSAYSFPKKIDEVNQDILDDYKGMRKFINSCEPMIDAMDVSSTLQRKFRNQWGSLWKNVAKDLELTEQDEKMLTDLGLKICFADMDSTVISEDTFNFINSILLWSVFLLSETNIDSSDLSALEIIDLMVISDSFEFITWVSML